MRQAIRILFAQLVTALSLWTFFHGWQYVSVMLVVSVIVTLIDYSVAEARKLQ
jgi:hypothetical protein